MRFRVRFNDQDEEIEVVRHGDLLRIGYGGQTVEARLIHTDGAHFVLEVEEEGPEGFVCRKRIRAAGIRGGDRRQLWANGRLVQYELLREGAPAQLPGGVASLSTSIPAVVSEILITVGDVVAPGQKLILLESMKMILPVQSPYRGMVKAINCNQGEAVQPGRQLVEIEEVE